MTFDPTEPIQKLVIGEKIKHLSFLEFRELLVDGSVIPIYFFHPTILMEGHIQITIYWMGSVKRNFLYIRNQSAKVETDGEKYE